MKHPTVFACGSILLIGVILLSAGCDQLGIAPLKSSKKPVASVRPASFRTRAQRRAFDGAPPVIAHDSFGTDCNICHTAEGREVPTVGMAPANPHLGDQHAGTLVNCKQCHVFARTKKLFVKTDFEGLQQEYKPSERAHSFAPQVIPHSTDMRANCMACHGGVAARPEISCDHPHRTNCVQCHVEGSTVTQIEMLGSAVE